MLDRILIGSSAEPSDPNFKNVTLLLHGDGSNGAQNNTFIDSSTNNFTITRNGNTTQGSFSPYGSNWSNYFDGSGDYLTVPDNAGFSYGTGDFTIECFVFASGLGSTRRLYYHITTSSTQVTIYQLNTNYIGFYAANGGSVIVDMLSNTLLPANTWTHIAIVRSGNSFTLYQNGVSVATATSSASMPDPSGSVNIGALDTGNESWLGYISNFRVVKGTAVYTSAFTPSTTPLTAITNTSLLTCAYNRFRDGSTNNFTITRNGDVKVTNFAPFAPSSAYSTTTNGGSSYYDGDTDYLSVPNSTEFVLNGTFTLEAWVYPTGDYSKFQCIITKRAGNTPAAWQLYIEINTGYLAYYNGSGYVSTSQVPLNQWSHVAGVYDGTNINLYLNGVRVLQSATTNTDQSTDVKIGYHFSSVAEPFKGYLTDVRVVKGGQVYSGTTYTVPTAPLTAISGTSLLVRATNAAIFDNSMKNDLETVGNAQISTSVKKFGTGSMYFDGSGDYLAIPFSDQMKFGTGDFTIEFWIYPTADSGDWFPVSSIGNLGFFFGRRSSGGWGYGITGSAWEYSSGTNPTLNTWQHVAISRSGTSIRIFVNGTQVGTTQTSGSDYSLATGGTSIGSQGANYYVTGYMDEVRITKGVARYTANFTAPTAPFPNK